MSCAELKAGRCSASRAVQVITSATCRHNSVPERNKILPWPLHNRRRHQQFCIHVQAWSARCQILSCSLQSPMDASFFPSSLQLLLGAWWGTELLETQATDLSHIEECMNMAAPGASQGADESIFRGNREFVMSAHKSPVSFPSSLERRESVSDNISKLPGAILQLVLIAIFCWMPLSS